MFHVSLNFSLWVIQHTCFVNKFVQFYQFFINFTGIVLYLAGEIDRENRNSQKTSGFPAKIFFLGQIMLWAMQFSWGHYLFSGWISFLLHTTTRLEKPNLFVGWNHTMHTWGGFCWAWALSLCCESYSGAMWWFIPKCHGAMFRSSYSCTNNSFCGMVCKPPMSCFLKFPYSERGLLPPLQWTQVEVNRHIAYLNTVWVGVGMAAPVLLIIAVGVGAFIYCKKRFACHQKFVLFLTVFSSANGKSELRF